MAVNKNSTSYIYTFTVILVGVVAAILAGLSVGLKELQTENVMDEKRKFILKAAGIMGRDESLTKEEVKSKYESAKIADAVLSFSGSPISEEGISAFNLDIVKEFKSSPNKEDRKYPIFVLKGADDKNKFVIPMAGKGLWGPVWAYVAVDSDANSVFGAVFDHKSETPGLGAEIKDGEYFWRQFDLEKGKKISDASGKYQGISAIKGGGTKDNPHGIDGIAGATITSVGVGEMLKSSFEVYLDYMKDFKN
jgi:Na+-transporting NADH:ubiquinone oxidoreductase subunit C